MCDKNIDGQIVVYVDDICLLFSGSNCESPRQKQNTILIKQ